MPNSWPSMALVIFKYKFLKYDPALNKSKIENVGFQCGGNLIDRETILTAGHCLPIDIDRNQIHDDKNLQIVPNSFYPTYESMFTVYLGLHEKNEIFTNSTNGTVLIANVIEARRVIKLIFLLYLWRAYYQGMHVIFLFFLHKHVDYDLNRP